jgi:hypothetical protein
MTKVSFPLQAEPSEPDQAEPRQASHYSHHKPSHPKLIAAQLKFLNCDDVKPSACILINKQYLVQKPLIY